MVSLVSVVSFRPFRFVVSGFSTCLRILLQQLKEKNKQPKIFFRAQCETLRVD